MAVGLQFPTHSTDLRGITTRESFCERPQHGTTPTATWVSIKRALSCVE